MDAEERSYFKANERQKKVMRERFANEVSVKMYGKRIDDLNSGRKRDKAWEAAKGYNNKNLNKHLRGE